jgi:tetratricopeptide (TPR) repeat protein
MFDGVSLRDVLLVAIGLLAVLPSLYVIRHLTNDPDRRDITQPPRNLRWRTPRKLAVNGAAICVLAASAVFVSISAAKNLREPISSWANQIGTINWNLQPADDQAAERCFNTNNHVSAQEALNFCNKLMGKPSGYDREDLLVARGIAYYELNKYKMSVRDLSEAIRLNPGDYYAYYNRAIAYYELVENEKALMDFGVAIQLHPNDPDAYIYRAEVDTRIGASQQSVADLTLAIRLAPDRADAYRDRAAAFKLLGDDESAAKDSAEAARLTLKSVENDRRPH